MKELTNPNWIKAKGILFLFLGLAAAALLLIDNPSLKTAFLLALAIWCFCRFTTSRFTSSKNMLTRDTNFRGFGRSRAI